MKKVTVKEYDDDEVYCVWYKCNKCKTKDIMKQFKYCPECGSKIDWKNSK